MWVADGKEESSEGELSDSLECLNVLDSKRILGKKNIGKQHIPQVSQASRKEKKNFMSGKISKVHKVAPLATAPVDLPEDEDEEEEQRRLFKQASREVQHLGMMDIFYCLCKTATFCPFIMIELC